MSDGQAQDRRLLGTHGHDSELASHSSPATRRAPGTACRLRLNPDGSPMRFDALRPQRLAAPVTVYVEQFSAHPLERDAAELYGPPDGYLDASGAFHRERQGPDDVAGLRDHAASGRRPLSAAIHGPPGRRSGVGRRRRGARRRRPNGLASRSTPTARGSSRRSTGWASTRRRREHAVLEGRVRLLPRRAVRRLQEGPAGCGADGRRDGRHRARGARPRFLPVPPGPPARRAADGDPRPPDQRRAASARAAGGTPAPSGSRAARPSRRRPTGSTSSSTRPSPICGNASQRPHGALGNDGDRNIVDSVDYIVSRIWAGADGRDTVGAVVILDEQIFTSRDVQKADARPGGYVATGGHGGIVGSIGQPGPPVLTFRPVKRHTYTSSVRLSRAAQDRRRHAPSRRPDRLGHRRRQGRGRRPRCSTAIPKVTIVKPGRYIPDDSSGDAAAEVDILARIDKNLRDSAAGRLRRRGLGAVRLRAQRDRGGAPARDVQRDAGREGRPRQRRGHGRPARRRWPSPAATSPPPRPGCC